MTEPKNVIYGLYCTCHPDQGIRYVGQTSEGVRVRFSNHRAQAKRGQKSKVYHWMRKHGIENICCRVLEDVRDPRFLTVAETDWLRNLVDAGQDMCNTGACTNSVWKGIRRPDHSERLKGEGNPMYGKDRSGIMAHARSFQGPPTEATKAIWREQRKGSGNGRAIMTEEIVVEARNRYTGAYGELTRMADEYGVGVQTLRMAIKRQTWKHVP